MTAVNNDAQIGKLVVEMNFSITIMVYQIDYVWDSLENVMRYSYKRFLFAFVPLLWFYIAAGKNINLIFEKIDNFIWSPKNKERK
jgi:hypothetical protein